MKEAIEHLELYGYCLVEEAIPAEQADRMAESYYNLHLYSANRAWF